MISRILRRFLTSRPPAPEPPPRAIIGEIGEPFTSVLGSMYDGEPQLGADGQMHELDPLTRIRPRQGLWLYQLIREEKPDETLEIGLAYGFSTVYILAALHANGKGRHTALDPFQDGFWRGIGATRDRVTGVRPGTFEFSRETSVQGLARLARERRQFGVIFIDGNHLFDAALVDFFLAAPLCQIGGHVVLDDLWLPSIERVASFVRRNRADFVEVPTPIGNIAVFRRTDEDKRDWKHFVPF